MEGILALMIPVIALATGLVAVIRMPPEALASRRGRRNLPAVADNSGLAEEVMMLRDELAQMKERLDFTERLLMDPAAAPRLATPRPADAFGAPSTVEASSGLPPR
jgi:hypothetical protein